MNKKIILILMAIFMLFSFSFAETKLDFKAKSVYLMEESTGETLYEMNAHEQLRPASVTKVMTLLLIMEAIDNGTISMDDRVPCCEKAKNMGGSQIWLDPKEELTVNEMLKAICVVSANDCSVAMAEFIAGSEETFVDMMNKRAKELGMNDTVFKNCHGIDEDGHVTSAHDIALMSKELIKHDKIFNYTTIWMDNLRDGKSELVNTNKMIKFYKGADGIKTGSTSLALFNLSVTAKRDDMRLIGVVMTSPTSKERFSDATKLLDYGFASYTIVKLSEEGAIVGEVAVGKGEKNAVNGIMSKQITRLFKKGENKNIEKEVKFDNIAAPIKKGQKIGIIIYKQNGVELAKGDIIAEESIGKITFGKLFANIMIKWVKVGR
jgi:D-alanyl-D-alanine carboxypeptidase (penicillin-binding protein 5/6)